MQWLRLAETAAARRDAFHRAAAVATGSDRPIAIGACTDNPGFNEQPLFNVRFAPRKRKFVSAARRYADEVD